MRLLLSIKPKYAEKIFNGEKEYEYRKKLPADLLAGDIIVVYASAPIGKVIGEFVAGWNLKDSVNKIWICTGKWGGVSAEEFLEYFGCAETACAVRIRDARLYPAHIPLSEFGIKRPPQNYMFLKD